MKEFFFGTGRVSLAFDLARDVFWCVLLIAMDFLWWHDARVLLWLIPLWVAGTLIRHLWWRYHPEEPTPLTRYNADKR